MSLLRAALLSSCVAFTIAAPAASPDPIGDAMLVARQTGAVANDLQNGDCKAMTLIFARGTTEAGNMGSVVGPPFANALIQAAGAGNVAVQGVNNYPADVQGFLAGGDQGGSQEMADLVNQAMSACPTTQVIMSGYRYGHRIYEIQVSYLQRTFPVKEVNLSITPPLPSPPAPCRKSLPSSFSVTQITQTLSQALRLRRQKSSVHKAMRFVRVKRSFSHLI